MKFVFGFACLFFSSFAAGKQRRLDDWVTACANATKALEAKLVNATADWHDAVGAVYNASNFEDYCITDHFTSSCALDFSEAGSDAEADWSAACSAADGKLYSMDEDRFYCDEKETKYVRLLNYVGHKECVATVCEDEELKEYRPELVKNDLEFFGEVYDAKCKWEDKYATAGAAGKMASLVILASMVAASLFM